MARSSPLACRVSITSEVEKSMTLLGSGLRPVVVARVLIARLVCRSGSDGLGRRRDRGLHRGLNVCLGIGDSAGIYSDRGSRGGTPGRLMSLMVTTTTASRRTRRRSGVLVVVGVLVGAVVPF